MDNQKKAYENLLKGIQNYVKDVINKYTDRTYTGLIVGVSNSSDNTYIVNINGVQYTNVPTIGGTCTTNATVRVLVPQGNFSNMFILK